MTIMAVKAALEYVFQTASVVILATVKIILIRQGS